MAAKNAATMLYTRSDERLSKKEDLQIAIAITIVATAWRPFKRASDIGALQTENFVSRSLFILHCFAILHSNR